MDWKDRIMKIDKVLASALSFALGIYTVSAPAFSHTNMMITNADTDFNYEELLQGFSPKSADNSYSLGDVNNDGVINSNDASIILAKYSSVSTSGGNTFSEDEAKAADVDWSGKIDSSDASYILRYYAYASTTDNKMSMEDFMKSILNISETTTTTSTATTIATKPTTTTSTATTIATKPATTTSTATTVTTIPATTTSTATTVTTKPATTTSTATTVTTIPATTTSTATTVTTKPVTTTSTATTVTTKPATTTSTATTVTTIPETTTTTEITTTTEPKTTTTTEITTTTEPETTTTTEPETTTVPQISEIIPNLSTINCSVGYEDTIRFEILPENAEDTELVWESSDENIVSVDGEGQITAKSAGLCTITVSSRSNPDVKAEITINVTEVITEPPTDEPTVDDPTYVQGITLNHEELEISVGYLDVAYISYIPSTAIETGVEWTSSDESIATVDDQGWITAKKAGTCIITVQSMSNPSASASVTVHVTDPYAPKPQSIELSNRFLYFDAPEDTIQVTASVVPESVADKKILWSSSDERIAVVDEDGNITSKGKGQCIITATSSADNSITAEISVEVLEDEEIAAESIDLSRRIIHLEYVGQEYTVTANVLPENAVNKKLEWVSSNSRIATVDQNGKITAQSAGNCIITVISDYDSNIRATVSVEVSENEFIPIEKIVLSENEMEFDSIGGTKQLSAEIYPADSNETNIVWQSSDENVAVVDEYGKVTATGFGSCLITAISQDNPTISADAAVTVTNTSSDNRITSISITESSINLVVGGESKQAHSFILPVNAFNQEETWSTSNSNVAVVNEKGVITPVGAGSCIITVTSVDNPSLSASIPVTVTAPNTTGQVTGISLSTKNVNLTVGGQGQMPIVTMTPATATDKSEIWTSSNTNVATVNGDGLITPVGVGTCVVTVTSKSNPNVSATVNVTVNASTANTTQVTGISLSTKNVSLTVGGQGQMPIVTMTPATATDKSEIWTSSNTNVATVNSDGLITPVGVGTCVVTVTSKSNPNVSATVNVTVNGNNTTSSTITGISLSKYTMNLTVGQKDISWVTMTPSTAPESLKGEIWTSSNTAVATVDAYGNVTAVGAGTCTITVTSQNNRNVSAKITVNVAGNNTTSSTITGITLSKTTMNLAVGQKDISWVTMTPTTAPESLKGEIWTS